MGKDKCVFIDACLLDKFGIVCIERMSRSVFCLWDCLFGCIVCLEKEGKHHGSKPRGKTISRSAS